MKATFSAERAKQTESGTERIVISTSQLDRDGDQLEPRGIITDNYKKNPIVLWAHDYHQLPIGRCIGISTDESRVYADFVFLDGDDFADRVKNAWEQGCLNATSVGFTPLAWEPLPGGGRKYTKWDLLEFSIVPIPSNAGATRGASMIRTLKGLGLWGDELLMKGGRAISRENAGHVEGIHAMLADLDATHAELRKVTREAQACLRSGKDHIDALLAAARPTSTEGSGSGDDLDIEITDDDRTEYSFEEIAEAARALASSPVRRQPRLDLDGGTLDVTPAEIKRVMTDVVRQAIRASMKDTVAEATTRALNHLRGRLD